MALSLSSCLHYWSSRYGLNPIVGGRPVFTRNSAGLFTAQSLEVSTAIVNTPRFDWATLNLPNSLTERRKVLTLELARTSNLLWSNDLNNAVYAKLTMTVATGIADPRGGTSACRLTATGANAEAYQGPSASSSLARSTSAYLRRVTGSGNVKIIRADGGSADIVGPITTSWARYNGPSAPASTNRWCGMRLDTSGDVVDAFLCENEDGPFITAGIETTTAPATRATDSLYWNFPPVPQAFYLYVRFIEQGSGLSSGLRILEICDAPDNNPRFIVYNPATTGYAVFFHNGVSSVTSTLAAYPAIGDTVELVAQLQASGVVQLYQSINGAAITVSTGSAGLSPLPAAWSDAKLWLNSGGTVGGQGSSKFAELKIVKFADVVAVTNATIFAELQAFELGPDSSVL